MNYRIFRWLLIASIASLVLALALIVSTLLFGFPGTNRQFTQLLETVVENQSKLIFGSRQVSELLNIPSADYNDISNSAETFQAPELYANEGASSSNALEIAFYDALQYLEQNLEQERAWTELNQLLDSQEWQDLLEEYRLRFERSENSVRLFPEDDSRVPKVSKIPRGQVAPLWFEMKVILQTEKRILLELAPSLEGKQKKITSELSLSAELREFLRDNSEHLYMLAREYNDMYEFLSGSKVERTLEAKQLELESLQPEQEDRSTTTRRRIVQLAQTEWEVRTRDEQVVAKFYYDISSYQLFWDDKSYQSLQLLESDWDIFVEQVDTRSLGQRREDEMRKYLQAMLQDSAFLLQMGNYDLRVAELPPREDEYYEYYDLLDEQDQRVASFALQKRVGEAYLMDRDDVKIRSLKSFINGADDLQMLLKKTPGQDGSEQRDSAYFPSSMRAPELWGNSPEAKREVVLMLGTHDNMADVIMLVFINKQKQKLSFLSIPRDLYFQNTKINSLYLRYGPKAFMDTLSKIIHVPINKYVKIDMYAFVEVVNLIGGVDVYLEEDLIDPLYKIKQMGKWQTLVMRKGEHHLDGLGALRYARSRHTSSDFERSERQQIILDQVADKLQKQLNKPQKLLSFLQVVQKYMNTNFTVPELALYWLEYGVYQRSSGNTINTKNLLYYTYTNYLGLNDEELEEAKEDEDYPKGAFILLPRNNDWGLIRSYVQRLQKD